MLHSAVESRVQRILILLLDTTHTWANNRPAKKTSEVNICMYPVFLREMDDW